MSDTRDNDSSQQPADAGRVIVRQTLSALWRAWVYTRLFRTRTDVGALLPPLAEKRCVTALTPEELWVRVDRIAKVFAFWKFDKRCFYRSFSLATLLRQRGIPAGLEFGLRLENNKRQRCHCWVVADGRVIGEKTDPHMLFPIPVGEWDRCVGYRLADGDQADPRS